MCEYSLHTLPNRLAREGEHLVTYRFPTCTIGLASAAEIEAANSIRSGCEASASWWSALKSWLSTPQRPVGITAVCIPPGARLRVSLLSKGIRRKFCLGPVEEVTFTELTAEAYQFRDAIRLPNGSSLPLQQLDEGVHFEVLSLGSSEPEREPEPWWEAPAPEWQWLGK
jgi:hypothetical protein